MSTISRRSFLKLAGVTAVATAGASMLTGCSLVKYVTIIPVLNGEVVQGETPSVPLPGFIKNYDWAFDMVIPIVKRSTPTFPASTRFSSSWIKPSAMRTTSPLAAFSLIPRLARI